MQARYAHARLRLLEGGDHALSDFEDHLAAVMAFLGLRSRSKKWIKQATNAYRTSVSSSHF